MNRMQSVLLLSVMHFVFPGGSLSRATELPNTQPTNVLFIYVEDLGYYTSERAAREPNAMIAGLETPNLDALAKASVVFTRAFCGQSVCSPSKGAIYSGLLPHANGIWRNVHNQSGKFGGPENWIPLPNPLTKQNDPTNLAVPGMHEDLPNLVQLLTARDVYCALSGKLHVQPARNFPFDVFVDQSDLDSVIKAVGDKPWFFWCNPGDTHAPPEELYDLDTDPWGVRNLVNDPAYADVLTRLRKEFAQWRQSTGDADVHPSNIPRRE